MTRSATPWNQLQLRGDARTTHAERISTNEGDVTTTRRHKREPERKDDVQPPISPRAFSRDHQRTQRGVEKLEIHRSTNAKPTGNPPQRSQQPRSTASETKWTYPTSHAPPSRRDLVRERKKSPNRDPTTNQIKHEGAETVLKPSKIHHAQTRSAPGTAGSETETPQTKPNPSRKEKEKTTEMNREAEKEKETRWGPPATASKEHDSRRRRAAANLSFSRERRERNKEREKVSFLIIILLALKSRELVSDSNYLLEWF